MDDQKAKIVGKILKLFALGSSSVNQSETEVELAATKARQLMMEHSISEVDLETYGTDKAKRVAWIISTHRAYTLKVEFARYDALLAMAVDAICDTRNYTSEMYTGGHTYHSRHFIGTETDVAVASALFLTLLKVARNMARAQCGAGWKKAHFAYAEGLATRLAIRARNAKPSAPQTETMALVLSDKRGAVESWVGKNMNFRTLTDKEKAREEKKAQQFVEHPKFRDGWFDGEHVDIGNPKRRL